MPAVFQCAHCRAERRVRDQEMLELVQSHGMLRREAKPEPALVLELLGTIADQLTCNTCGQHGALLKEDWNDDWADEVLCEGCQVAIPVERLEIFPDTKFCPDCQSLYESGQAPGEEAEYCEACGGIMKLVKRGGAGLAGYTSVCSECGKNA